MRNSLLGLALTGTLLILVGCSSDPEPVAGPPATTPSAATTSAVPVDRTNSTDQTVPTDPNPPTDLSVPTDLTVPTDVVTLDISAYLSDAEAIASSLAAMTAGPPSPPVTDGFTAEELAVLCGEPRTVWTEVDATLQDLNMQTEPPAEDYKALSEKMGTIDVSAIRMFKIMWDNLRSSLSDTHAAILTNMAADKRAELGTKLSKADLELFGFFQTNCS